MKFVWLVGMLVCLTGCGSEAVFETVADELIAPVRAEPGEVTLSLPEDTVVPVADWAGGQAYLGEGYEICLETRPSGDLQETVRYLTGFDRDALTVMKTDRGNVKRYDFVWSCAGEKGQRIGRGAVLDDGQYHYCLSVLRDGNTSEEPWQQVFSSFSLE